MERKEAWEPSAMVSGVRDLDGELAFVFAKRKVIAFRLYDCI